MTDSIERIAREMEEPVRSGEKITNERLRDWATRLRVLSPAGGDWVMVPREPTDAMVVAAMNVGTPYGTNGRRDIWAAMLAASPQQEPGVAEPKCHDCFGHGILLDADITCPRCNGRGKACGGCGETDENKRCIGCQHVFTPPAPSGQTLAGAGGDELCFTCRNPKHEGPCGEPQWGSPKMCDKLLARALTAEKALTATSAGTTGDAEDASHE